MVHKSNEKGGVGERLKKQTNKQKNGEGEVEQTVRLERQWSHSAMVFRS